MKKRYLAMLGDIGYPPQPKYQDLLLEMAGKFQKVFVLAGNHGNIFFSYLFSLFKLAKMGGKNEKRE
jgi:hypothetical protein